MHILDEKFKRAVPNYLLQSLLAAMALMVIMYFVKVLTEAAIIAAIGATTFIVFAMPNYVTAQPRRVIGGHVVGLAA